MMGTMRERIDTIQEANRLAVAELACLRAVADAAGAYIGDPSGDIRGYY